MATYIVKPGDSLSAIAKRLGLSGWQELYNRNKSVIGSNPNLIRPGQVLIYGNDSSSSSPSTTTTPSTTSSPSTTTTPSTTVGNILAATVEDPTRQNFIKKYGTMESLMPTAMFNALGEQMVNPYELQNATRAMEEYDRNFARMGGYRSRGLQAMRDAQIRSVDKARQEAINQFIQSQKDLFSKWYTQEMYNYQTSKVPDQYTLSKFGIENPSGETQEYTVSPNATQYKYTTPYNASSIFRYGGYSKPVSMYNMPTPIS